MTKMVRKIISRSSALYDRLEMALGIQNPAFHQYRASLLSQGEAHADAKFRVKVTPTDEKKLEALLFDDDIFMAKVRDRYTELSRLYQELMDLASKYD